MAVSDVVDFGVEFIELLSVSAFVKLVFASSCNFFSSCVAGGRFWPQQGVSGEREREPAPLLFCVRVKLLHGSRSVGGSLHSQG